MLLGYFTEQPYGTYPEDEARRGELRNRRHVSFLIAVSAGAEEVQARAGLGLDWYAA